VKASFVVDAFEIIEIGEEHIVALVHWSYGSHSSPSLLITAA
jgi:hypothetical protein